MSDAAWIKDVKTDQFEAEVVEKSSECPVIVDFWAPWCGPCQQLKPLLEQIVNEYAGRVVLAKVNTDEEPALAQTFGVQSIPMVVAIRDGQFVDRFDGLLPEDVLRKWIANLLPSEADTLVKQGQAAEATDPAAAEASYRQALDLEPDRDDVKIRLAAACLAQNKADEARAIIDALAARGYLEPEAERIQSQLELEAAAAEAGGITEARQAAEADPENVDLQIKLADALAVNRQHAEAFEICLELVRRDRSGAGERARETMVKIFNTLGNEHPLVGEYRRKLATALY